LGASLQPIHEINDDHRRPRSPPAGGPCAEGSGGEDVALTESARRKPRGAFRAAWFQGQHMTTLEKFIAAQQLEAELARERRDAARRH
jgi:hypothetical protein